MGFHGEREKRLAIGGLRGQTWPVVEVTGRQTLTQTQYISFIQSSLRCNRLSSGRGWKTLYQECPGKKFGLGDFRGPRRNPGLVWNPGPSNFLMIKVIRTAHLEVEIVRENGYLRCGSFHSMPNWLRISPFCPLASIGEPHVLGWAETLGAAWFPLCFRQPQPLNFYSCSVTLI